MVEPLRQSLLTEKAKLERRLKEIEQELAEANRRRSNKLNQTQQLEEAEPSSLPDSIDKPLRQIIIGMLSDTGHMLTNTTIRYLYEARFHKTLQASRLGTLSYDELNRKNKWNTTVYGLTHPIQLLDGELIRVKNVWARSDWPINYRVYLPTTTKLLNLHFLDWYITTSESKPYRYLQSPLITQYIDDIVHNLGLEARIKPPFNSIQAKKITVQEIELTKELQEAKYSQLTFRTLAAHQKLRKDYDPLLDAKTDLNIPEEYN